MKSLIIRCIIVGAFTLAACEAYNILAVVPFKSRSHFIVIEALLKGLTNKGHNLTVVSVYPQKPPIGNFHDIDVSQGYTPSVSGLPIDFVLSNMRSPHQSLMYVWEIGVEMCNAVFKDNKFQDLINTTQKFDLVLTEIFSCECFVPFAYELKVPLVSIVTSSALPWMNARVGNPDNPSYIVNYAYGFKHQMTFVERLQNFLFQNFALIGNYYMSDNKFHEMAKQYFGNDLPRFSEIYENTSLILVNSHFSINQARPFVPNVKEIGGIHLSGPQQLSKDLQILLDEARDGAIVFSFGSIMRASSLPEHVKSAFIDAFTRIPQLVIWKYEQELENLSPNVILRKWIPQSDVLAHKNVKLLITHGGQASCIETVYHGIPVIGIPMFADQPGNIMNLVNRGIGIHIDFYNITAESVYNAIQTILNDKSYKENAEKLSVIFRDRESTPLESAIYWIEYVIRHKGAPQLRTSANHLSVFQLYLLDVIGFILLTVILIVFIVKKIIEIVLKPFAKKSKANKRKQKKA